VLPPAKARHRAGGLVETSILELVAPTIGRSMRRREDPKLITGRGRYAGDIHPDGVVHMAVVRSTQPHARITAIDAETARAMPGVLAVWTSADLPEGARALQDWLPRGLTPRPRLILAQNEVNYVGEAIAAVVAETPYQAADAAEAVFADLDPLPAAGTVEAAVATGAPLVHEGSDSNAAHGYDRSAGDIDAAFAGGPVTVKERFKVARIAGAAMEPRAVTAEPTEAGLRIWTSTQHT